MPNRLEEMELFTRVVELGSFTAASRSLHIPKASATTRIQGLERRLGVTLLHRTTRRLSLTTEGTLYYEECVRLLKELEELENSLTQSNASPRGRLRIDVAASSGRHLIAPALPAFLDRYPDITVELGSTDRAVDLVAEGVDVVIRGGDLHDESLSARKLGELSVVTVASPAYLKKHGTPKHPDELKTGHVFVNFFSSRTGRVFEVDFVKGKDERSFIAPHRVAANDTDTWVALAVAGAGLLQAPEGPEVKRLITAGALVRVMPQWTAPALPVFVLWPQSRRPPARVRVFIDWIVDHYASLSL